MRRLLPLLSLLAAPLASAQPEPYGPWPQLGIPDPPLPIGAAAHRLSPAADGLILSYLQGTRGGAELSWIRLTEEGWGEPRTVTSHGKMLANWADVPAVVEGGDGALYAHWLLTTLTTADTYDIRVLRSSDAGETWTELGTLNDDDGYIAEHGFVSYLPDPRGVRAYWLDGRETARGDLGLVKGFMTLRTTIIGEAIEPSELIDDQVCDCCTTGAVLTDAGPLVVYRDRTPEEVRDIAAAGGAWGSPRVLHPDGWVIPGCPVNGPAVDADGANVVIAWYTAGGNRSRILAAFSTDSGATFSDPVVVDESRGQDGPLGRVDVVLDGDEAIVSWLANRHRAGTIVLQRIDASGLVGEAKRLAPMDTGRLSGFPEMERLGDRVIVVWRDPKAQSLRAAAMGLRYIGR